MVGAGFSRNAVTELGQAVTVPAWSEIALAMQEKLYGADDERCGLRAEISADQSLALAQEYEIAFGRDDLHRFLKEQINDEAMWPGKAHKRLLALPWRDVFTTNWDTLLERASEDLPGPPLGVLRNTAEMAIASGSRIIKLHGSLPAQFPLIVTEEDYRKYPTRFAPFVNTVQQAMMETTLLLVGFSGRDPNFLQWSGWVRDQLGSSAPKIYLSGWLHLHPHERRVLENRNVVPIDLAQHPKGGEWKAAGHEHRYATEWILHTLELGRPYPRHHWPSPSLPPDEPPPDYLQPVKWIDSPAPKGEPSPDEDDPVDGEGLLAIWKHNRRLYPGWLAVPRSLHAEFSRRTSDWESVILRDIEDSPVETRVQGIHEILWRRRVLLQKLIPAVAQAARKTLKDAVETVAAADDRAEAIDRRAVHCIVAELLVDARLDLDEEYFDHVEEIANAFAIHDAELGHIVQHERCLWTMLAMDFDSLRRLLEGWSTDHGDPHWKVRKAALLLESGIDTGVRTLVRQAIVELRNRGSAGREIANVSRDAWASLFMDHLKGRVPERHWERRGEEIAAYARDNCDVWYEIQIYRQVLDPVPKKEVERTFDLGSGLTTTIKLPHPARAISGRLTRQEVVSFQAIRLGDVMGLPPAIGHWAVTQGMIARAAEELFETRPDLALRLMLRAVRYDGDKLLEKLLTRTRVARLPSATVRSVLAICNKMVEQSLPPFVSVPKLGGSAPIERLRVAVEVRSRVSVRLRGEQATEAFRQALELYSDRSIGGHVWMERPLRNALTRAWEALRPTQRGEVALEVLACPIQGQDGFLRGQGDFPDPGMVLGQAEVDPPRRDADNEREWERVVRSLVSALTAQGKARAHAATRLAHIAIWGLFSEAELGDVAKALWTVEDDVGDELPTGTELFDWAFLLLPEPEVGIARDAFRRKWMAPREVVSLSDQDVDASLWKIGDALRGKQQFKFDLDLLDDESAYIGELIARWSRTPAPVPQPILPATRVRMHRATVGCAELLMGVPVPPVVMEALFKKLTVLDEAQIPALFLVPALMAGLPARSHEILSIMRNALASDGPRARDATRALLFWLRDARNNDWSPPPNDLIREVGVIVATRRKAALVDALSVVECLFTSSDADLWAVVKDLVVEGLGYLLKDLDYGREDMPTDLNVPEVRWRCAAVAAAIEQADPGEEIVSAWIRESAQDPMPEVRYAGEEIRFGTS